MQAWTSSPIARKLQEWYPNPPLVMFMSNNEHGHLEPDKIETDRRYLARFGMGKDNNFKGQVLEKGFTERMQALQQGMRDSMSSETWRKNAIFCGYEVVDRPYWRDSPGSFYHVDEKTRQAAEVKTP